MKTCNIIGVPRRVKKKQTNAVQFEPAAGRKDGSWLWWPKASNVIIAETGDVKYVIIQEADNHGVLFECMAYELVPIPKEVTA
jgi:hypothetical protein